MEKVAHVRTASVYLNILSYMGGSSVPLGNLKIKDNQLEIIRLAGKQYCRSESSLLFKIDDLFFKKIGTIRF